MLFVSFLILVVVPAIGQKTSYPPGAYLNLEELQKKHPSMPLKCVISRRTKTSIIMNGGNDYKVTDLMDTIPTRTLSRKIYAIASGDSLYLNGFAQGLQFDYMKVMVEGKYFVFRGGIPFVLKKELGTRPSGAALFALGGAFGGASGALVRYLYILDATTGTLKYLNDEYLRTLLENAPTLKSGFAQEPMPQSEVTLIKYVQLLNAQN